MDPVSVTTTIDVPRERVHDLLCDLAARPSFCDHFLSDYRLERLDPVGVGAAARFRLGDSKQWMETTIEAAERPHLVRERGRGGRLNRVPTATVWELAPGPMTDSCEVTVTFWTEPAHLVDRIREALRRPRPGRRDWRRALERLRDLCESERAPERVGVAGVSRVGV
ncbi:MAG TPA: SRPBCC family protein [Solirubrobacterales bacterium]|nr:SRPBCC family protein [Solirubrobacterales bacterium]